MLSLEQQRARGMISFLEYTRLKAIAKTGSLLEKMKTVGGAVVSFPAKVVKAPFVGAQKLGAEFVSGTQKLIIIAVIGVFAFLLLFVFAKKELEI